MYTEEYEHAEFGEIAVTWSDRDRTHLIAIQADFWTPVEEITACIKWARNLQHEAMTRGGDAVMPHHN